MFMLAGLQNRCGSVFSLLAAAACPDSSTGGKGESPGRRRLGRPRSMLKLLQKQHKLHTSHALSMDVLLGRGLELGSHSPDCWTHVFRSVEILFRKQKLKSVMWQPVEWMIKYSVNWHSVSILDYELFVSDVVFMLANWSMNSLVNHKTGIWVQSWL